MKGILLGLSTGIVAAATWIYAMQPNIVYPEWILTSFDHPWTLLVFLFIIAYIAYYVSLSIGALLFLMFIALVLDLSVFGRQGSIKAPIADRAGAAGPVGDFYAQIPDVVGPPVTIEKTPEPIYSMFYGLHDLQPGEPAGF